MTEDKQMGGKQMSLANIIDSNIINPFKVDDSAKVNEENCCNFLDNKFWG